LPIPILAKLTSPINSGTFETCCRIGEAIGIKAPVTRETVDKYTEDIAVEGSFIQKEIGFIPQYDLKTGREETIRML